MLQSTRRDVSLTTPHAKRPSKSWSVRLVQLVRARHEDETRLIRAKPGDIKHPESSDDEFTTRRFDVWWVLEFGLDVIEIVLLEINGVASFCFR